jgi:hypothetical protein
LREKRTKQRHFLHKTIWAHDYNRPAGKKTKKGSITVTDDGLHSWIFEKWYGNHVTVYKVPLNIIAVLDILPATLTVLDHMRTERESERERSMLPY